MFPSAFVQPFNVAFRTQIVVDSVNSSVVDVVVMNFSGTRVGAGLIDVVVSSCGAPQVLDDSSI